MPHLRRIPAYVDESEPSHFHWVPMEEEGDASTWKELEASSDYYDMWLGWAQTHGIRHILIEPGRPMQNGYIESFNGKFRDECLSLSRAMTKPPVCWLRCRGKPRIAFGRASHRRTSHGRGLLAH